MDPIHIAVIERQKLKELQSQRQNTITTKQKSKGPRVALQRLSKSFNKILAPNKVDVPFKLISFGKNDRLY
jgi:hypothetical protein